MRDGVCGLSGIDVIKQTLSILSSTPNNYNVFLYLYFCTLYFVCGLSGIDVIKQTQPHALL